MISEQVKRGLRWVKVSGDADLSRFPGLPHHRPAAHGHDLAARAPALPSADLSLRAEGALLLQQPEDARPEALRVRRARLLSALLPRTAVAARREDGDRARGSIASSIARSCAARRRPATRRSTPTSSTTSSPLNPDIRAILMIRNPIDRAWSHAKKDLVRNRKRKFDDVARRRVPRLLRRSLPAPLRALRRAVRQLGARGCGPGISSSASSTRSRRAPRRCCSTSCASSACAPIGATSIPSRGKPGEPDRRDAHSGRAPPVSRRAARRRPPQGARTVRRRLGVIRCRSRHVGAKVAKRSAARLATVGAASTVKR